MTSRHTKDALAAAKRRGVKLGGYRAGSKADSEGPQGRSGRQRAHRGGAAAYQPGDRGATGGRRCVLAGHRSGPERAWDTNRARHRSLVCDKGVRTLARR